MKNDIKLGIIGTNFVSDWLCEAVEKTDGIASCLVYSRTAEKGGEFALKHNIPNVTTDLEEFFSSDIDAVYIASPNFLHYHYARQAILHGKHVLVEKPGCVSEAQFADLIRLAAENGVTVLEAMRPGHDPAVEEIRANLGKIGTVRRAVFDFCQYSSRYDRFRSGEILNAFNPELGNAAIMDIGCYAIHVCVMLFGEPEKIWSESVKLHNGFEGMGTIFLRYADFTAEVVYAKIIESYNPSIITGEDGTLRIGKLSTIENAYLKPRGGEERTVFSSREGDNMVYEVADFVRCINGKLSAEGFHKNTLAVMRIIDEVRRQNGIVFPDEGIISE